MRISAVITAFNEGTEVRSTIESLIRSITPFTETQLEIILVDDGSSDGSCDKMVKSIAVEGAWSLKVLRHGKPWGIGRSRNHGWLECTGDVVFFLDAHMRFPIGVLEALSDYAWEHECIAMSASEGFAGQSAFEGRGCDLYYNMRDAMQAQWQQPPEDAEEWRQVACTMGACYAIPRKQAEVLEAATGQLWEDTDGRWGFSEQGISIKAFLLGIPIVVSHSLFTQHFYRSTNPIPDPVLETRKSIVGALASIFSKRTFRERFLHYATRQLDPVLSLPIIQDRHHEELPWSYEDEQKVFTHLCGLNAPVSEPHPEHAWLADVEAQLRIKTPKKVLVWRPGEVLFLLKRLAPEAEWTVIEAQGPRSTRWRDACKQLGVDLKIHEVNTPCYAYSPVRNQPRSFDMVLINGERQEDCMLVAGNICKEGPIIVGPLADRTQIIKEHREAEEALLARKEAVQAAPAPQKEPVAGEALLTVMLLNYKRPANLPVILDCLGEQTVPLQVWVWNNGAPLKLDKRYSTFVQAVRGNMGCWPRWLMASMVDTEYVCSMDDDLIFSDKTVLEDAISECREKRPVGVVGFFGWIAQEGKNYKDAVHIRGSDVDRNVDLIKGRFMLFQTRLLKKVPLRPDVIRAASELSRCDDILINLCIAQGMRKVHLVPGRLGRRWKELPKHGHMGNEVDRGHYAQRDDCINRLLAHYQRCRSNPAKVASGV